MRQQIMDYPDWLVHSLQDPRSGGPLTRVKGGFAGEGGASFQIVDGILSVVHPESLGGMDEKMNRRYGWLAPFYDASERVLGRLLTGVDIVEGRAQIVDLLNLRRGIRLLEVSPGPGVFQHLLRSSAGEDAEIVAVDLSLPMLRQCQSLQPGARVHLVHANAAYLPFADGTFDALFHFGGINLFNEPQRALSEFVRVTKPGGLVAYGDEGFAPDYAGGLRMGVLRRMNPGFSRRRPDCPAGLCNVSEHIVYGGLGYLIIGVRNNEHSLR